MIRNAFVEFFKNMFSHNEMEDLEKFILDNHPETLSDIARLEEEYFYRNSSQQQCCRFH